MKVIRKPNGTVNVSATLDTIAVDESLVIKESDVKVDYLRSLASKKNRATGAVYSISNSKDLKGKIRIHRQA